MNQDCLESALSIVGRHEQAYIVFNSEKNCLEQHDIRVGPRALKKPILFQPDTENLDITKKKVCIQCSMQPFPFNVPTEQGEKSFYLLGTVWKMQMVAGDKEDHCTKYSSNLYLMECQSNHIKILSETTLCSEQKEELRMHLLPCCLNNSNRTKSRQDEEEDEISFSVKAVTNTVLLLTLQKSMTVFTVESSPLSKDVDFQKLEVKNSETSLKNGFWWTQYVPQFQFLAYIYTRAAIQSSLDEECPAAESKSILSVLQFHAHFPTESVLNSPLVNIKLANEDSEIQLVDDCNIFSLPNVQLKLLAHSSGAVYLFYIDNVKTSTKWTYNLNLLHHNKTLSVHNLRKGLTKVDLSLYPNDQHVIVIGWPYFVHILDIGVSHEPSHHLILDCQSLQLQSYMSPFLEIHDLTIDTRRVAHVVYKDFTCKAIELNSSNLIPLMEKAHIHFRLAALHFLLIHNSDINAAKRVVYDEGRRTDNVHLKKIYQEFLVASAFLQTRKQLMGNLEPFLQLIPYCPPSLFPPETPYEECEHILELKSNSVDVTTMLLSPNQRVFPHNITDLWTSLWDMTRSYKNSHRFSHKNIAEKLLLSLQCYKPEALSRASTPMSPSSPMICPSFGDMTSLFTNRRTTELQLPFAEHESCTANKQEYVFSINLRELSMHLLKERKDWPLHGHNVAGKYVGAIADSARLLCHLACLTVHLQPTRTKDKGFRLIDSLTWETKLRLFLLLEHYSVAMGTLACPLPQGFTPFFAFLGYRVLDFHHFLWHVRAGTFDLQIDLVKAIMADLKETEEEHVVRKVQLISLLPKSRANRILNGWSHPVSIGLRARQHASDLLSGVVPQNRKSIFIVGKKKRATESTSAAKERTSALDTFFQLLNAKASSAEIDLTLLTEATVLSMDEASSSTK